MRRLLGVAAAPVGVAAAAVVGFHLVPSVVALGQWAPIRALPGGWCRWRGAPRHRVALTFDDGPDPRTTEPVLARLDELGLRATFFLLGSRAEEAPAVVRAIRRAGHEIGSHGYAHDHHFLRSPRWVVADLDASLAVLAAQGLHPRWYRPPYGQATGATLGAARRRGLVPVLWSAWGREWAARDATAVAARVARGLEPGAIVLLHDSDACSPPGTTAKVLDALPHIAAELTRRRLEAVTLTELVS